MTIDEAIKHCKEEAEKYMEYGIETECYQCGKEHEQLVDWLTELKEATRLLKLTLEDLAEIPCNNDVYIPSSCNVCIKQGNCGYSDSFKWRYADEALKLIGGEQND